MANESNGNITTSASGKKEALPATVRSATAAAAAIVAVLSIITRGTTKAPATDGTMTGQPGLPLAVAACIQVTTTATLHLNISVLPGLDTASPSASALVRFDIW